MTARYASSSRYTVDDDNQAASRGAINSTRFTVVRAREKDTLETIASRNLGDFTRWWEVADLNPQFKFPLDIQPGDMVRVPL